VKWREGARVVGGDGHKALVKKVCCVIFKGLGNQILVALEGWDGQAGGEGWLTRPGHTEDLSINLIIARHGCVACVQCMWVSRGREGKAERERVMERHSVFGERMSRFSPQLTHAMKRVLGATTTNALQWGKIQHA
jgi:hypothetical protein